MNLYIVEDKQQLIRFDNIAQSGEAVKAEDLMEFVEPLEEESTAQFKLRMTKLLRRAIVSGLKPQEDRDSTLKTINHSLSDHPDSL